MKTEFRLEVVTDNGGYGFTNDLETLLSRVEDDFGKHVKNQVKEWAVKSKERDQFKTQYGLTITNIGS